MQLMDAVKSSKKLMKESDLKPLEITEEIAQGLEYLGLDQKNFYRVEGFALTPYCYLSDIDMIEIMSFKLDVLDMMQIKKRIITRDKEFRELMRDGEWLSYFVYLDKRISMHFYKKLFKQIPDESKFEIFKEIYTRCDFGFDVLEHDFMEEVLKHKPKKVKGLNYLKFDNKGYLEIFRGANKDSTPLDKTYSWTASFYTALFFANRFNREGIVYKAKVHKDNIIDYLDNRGEKEILVSPAHVEDVADLNMYKVEELLNEFNEYGGLYFYHKACNDKKFPKLFKNQHGVHEMLHSKRVMLLCAIICYLYELDDFDTELLVTCGKYHDIGREHDGECLEHGYNSFKKAMKLKLLDDDSEDTDRLATIQYIIENHCLPDEIAKENLKKYDIYDKCRAGHLFRIFKDADALDRVRLGDSLDINYLRNNLSVRLANVAYFMVDNIE